MALPVGAASLDEADAAIELWEHYKGRKLDDGQRLDVYIMLATRDDGLWAASVTGHEKPRQSGKGDAVEVVELWGLTERAERILHTIHDAVLLATETQSRMLSLLDGHPDLRRLKAREWKGTGQQMIEMRNGGVIWYRTRTGAGGRGIDEVDRLVVDEAQHAEPEHLAAITPTQAVAANPQLNALGTGALEGKSAWWWSLRKQSKGEPGAFGYLGWSAQHWHINEQDQVVLEPVDASDRDVWRETIPALAVGRVSMEFLEREYRVLGPVGFAQEYLCVWAPPVDGDANVVISPDRWADLLDANVEPPDNDPSLRLALDAPPDRMSATFAVAFKRPDGLTQIQTRFHVPPAQMADTIRLAKALCEGHKTSLIIPSDSPAMSWRTELESAGVPLDVMTPGDTVAAFGHLLVAVSEGTVRHRGQPEMTNAVAGLAVKKSGDVDKPARRNSSTNIAPFIAAMCALYRVPEGAPKVAEASVVFA